MNRALIVTSVASMISQFNIPNIKLLIELGYKVTVATNFKNPGNIPEDESVKLINFLEEMDVECINIPFSRNPVDKHNIESYKILKEIITSNGYKLIHCQSPIGGAITRLAAKGTSGKIIYTAHGFHFFKGAPLKNWVTYYPLEKYLSRYTDVLITINNEDFFNSKKFHAKKLKKVHGVGIETHHNIIDDDKIKEMKKELGILKNQMVFISVGELNDNKNHSIVLKAFSTLTELNYQYLIIGQGPKADELQMLINKYELTDNIKLLGYRDDVPELLSLSDVFIFPSYREGLSKALMEAMSYGLPVIASKIRGNIDLVCEKKGGYLFNPNDYRSLSKKIKNLYYHGEKRKSFSEWNKDIITEYDMKKVNEEMKEIYKYILEIK